MDMSKVYDKFIKAVENEEFTKLGEAVGYSVFDLAEVAEKNISFKQLKSIISIVSENEEITDAIDSAIQEELDKIPESEKER